MKDSTLDTFFKKNAPRSNIDSTPEQRLDKIQEHVYPLLSKFQNYPDLHPRYRDDIKKLLELEGEQTNIETKIELFINLATFLEGLQKPGIDLTLPPLTYQEYLDLKRTLHKATPNNHVFREAAVAFYTQQDQLKNQSAQHSVESQSGASQSGRPDNMTNVEIPDLVRTHLHSGVYNIHTVDGSQFPLNLRHEIDKEKSNGSRFTGEKVITREVVAPIEDYIRTESKNDNLVYLVPFVNERDSMIEVMKYLKKIGARVITPNAATDPELIQNRATIYGKRYGVDYFPQYAELDKINWEELSQQCGLPFTAYDHQTHSFQNKIGTKGATVASAIMRIITMEQGGNIQPRANVVFHDSDIVNPDSYMGAHYLAWATMNNPDSVATLIAKSGLGRNNENTMHAVVSALKKAQSEKVKNMAAEMVKLVWPHTGERRMRLDFLKNMPMALGMDIEQVFNIYAAGIVSDGKSSGITQTMNPEPKNECQVSSYSREMGQMQPLADSTFQLLMFLDKKNKYLHELTISDYQEYNQDVGGKITTNSYASIEGQLPVQPTSGVVPFLLPSYSYIHEKYYQKT